MSETIHSCHIKCSNPACENARLKPLLREAHDMLYEVGCSSEGIDAVVERVIALQRRIIEEIGE